MIKIDFTLFNFWIIFLFW